MVFVDLLSNKSAFVTTTFFNNEMLKYWTEIVKAGPVQLSFFSFLFICTMKNIFYYPKNRLVVFLVRWSIFSHLHEENQIIKGSLDCYEMVGLGFMKLPFDCSVGATFQDIIDSKEFDCQTINVWSVEQTFGILMYPSLSVISKSGMRFQLSLCYGCSMCGTVHDYKEYRTCC